MYMCNQPLIVTCTIKERSRIECEPDLVHPIFVLSHSVYNNKSMSMHYCSIQLINLYLHALVHSTCVPHAHSMHARLTCTLQCISLVTYKMSSNGVSHRIVAQDRLQHLTNHQSSCKHVCVCVCVRTCVRACVRACMCVCVCVH